MEKETKETNAKKRKIGIIVFTSIILLTIFIAICLVSGLNTDNCNNAYQKISYIASNEFRDKKLENMISSTNNYIIISNYNTYTTQLSYIKKMSYQISGIDNKYNSKFFDTKSLLVVECNTHGSPNIHTNLIEMKEEGNTINVKIEKSTMGVTADTVGAIYFIPIEKNITAANITFEQGNYYNISDMLEIDYKPIIYLYPETEQEVSVKVGNEDRLTCTYPKYNNGWNVIAKPNGDLIDTSTGRNLYALYWEGIDINAKIEKDGFVVKGEDSIEFLEEKLEILGLNEREAQEFIVYWLPKLEANKYNYIRFETQEEIEHNMPLIINPIPDTVIRIVMNFKGLDRPITVEEQQLVSPKREGFTVVEWGGTEIK